MYISLYDFNFDNTCTTICKRQENYHFIRKVFDKRTKIKSKCCRGGGLSLWPLTSKGVTIYRDVEIFLDTPVILTDFENLASPNNEICSRNINFLSVRMKFCQTNPSV